MGQQQLLLIVLGAVIVGIAVVVGINMFGSSAEQANIDAVRADVLTFASSAQAYYKKPTMLGGGGNDFTNITFNDVNFPADTVLTNVTAQNANGDYEIANRQTGQLSFIGYPESVDDTLTATITDGDIQWQ